MLISHPKIYLDARARPVDALLVRDGRVVATGQAARDARAPQETTYEPDAACVMPALTDAHCHLWGVGLRAGALELDPDASPRAVYDALRAFDHDASPSGWALGHGWDDRRWPRDARWSRAELDAALPDTPLCLHRVDRHAIVVNGEALRRAGLPEDYAHHHASGRVLRDAAGRVSVLVDTAMRPLLESIPACTAHEDAAILAQTARRYRNLGITCAHMALLEPERVAMLEDLQRKARLPLRVYGIVDAFHQDIPEVLDRGPIHDDEAWLSIRAAKLFADGALGSQGALLLDGYADGTRGIEMMSPQTLAERTQRYTDAGFQVATHAIGDAAASAVLDAYAAIDADTRRRSRLRLEHAQMMTPADARRMVELGVIASIQAIHLRSDATWAPRTFTDAQLDRLYPWHHFAEAHLASGSDFPIEDPNPWHGIATAMTRLARDGSRFQPDRTLTLERALASYTTGAAYAAFWEDRLGQLHPGFIADFITLDRDPFHEAPSSIWDTQVEQTWIAGQLVE